MHERVEVDAAAIRAGHPDPTTAVRAELGDERVLLGADRAIGRAVRQPDLAIDGADGARAVVGASAAELTRQDVLADNARPIGLDERALGEAGDVDEAGSTHERVALGRHLGIEKHVLPPLCLDASGMRRFCVKTPEL